MVCSAWIIYEFNISARDYSTFLIVNLTIYGAMQIWFTSLLGIISVALRVRMLQFISATPSVSYQELVVAFKPDELIQRRIERLLKTGQVKQTDGKLNMTASVLIDKILGLFAMTVLAAGLLWGLNLSGSLFNTTKHVLAGVLLFFFVAFLIAHIPWEKFLDFFSHHPRIAFLADQTEKFLTYVRTASSNWYILALSVTIFAVIFTINTFVYLEFFAITVQGAPEFFQTMAVILTITIITNLPISLNGIGVREQTHFLYFAALGLPKEATVGIAVLVFAQMVILSLIGYGLWVSRKRFER